MITGALAGAAGTLALEAVTYLDMAVRGRPPSDLPATMAGRTAEALRLPLGAEPRAGHRRTALGALGGHATGVSLGAVYGLAGRRLRGAPLATAGSVLGVAAMIGANLPAVASGVTDPRRWGLAGWLADLVPHAAYGIATAACLDSLGGGSPRQPGRDLRPARVAPRARAPWRGGPPRPRRSPGPRG
ncbi:MAG TPA: hypothetical protein VFZ68_09170 [Acidimicrobiales bacterium]